jgi:hypothetical protein
MANSCLSVLNKVNNKCLVGIDVRDALSDADHELHHQMQNGKQICYLARTNLTLFKKVVEVLGCDVASSSQKPKTKISFAGVSPTYFWLLLLAIDTIMNLIVIFRELRT